MRCLKPNQTYLFVKTKAHHTWSLLYKSGPHTQWPHAMMDRKIVMNEVHNFASINFIMENLNILLWNWGTSRGCAPRYIPRTDLDVKMPTHSGYIRVDKWTQAFHGTSIVIASQQKQGQFWDSHNYLKMFNTY